MDVIHVHAIHAQKGGKHGKVEGNITFETNDYL
jgi:hypothetical protein